MTHKTTIRAIKVSLRRRQGGACMTRHIPEGNSLRDFSDALAPLRAIAARNAGFDIYPSADIDRRLASMPPRVQTRPPLRLVLAAVAWALMVIALAFGAGWFASRAVANAAAAVVQAEAI